MNSNLTRRRAGLLMLGAALAASRVLRSDPASAAPASLPAPAQSVVLTISGKIADTNDGTSATFDMPMLEAMPQHSFSTKTPWYSGPSTFQGVLMRDLMQRVGAAGTNVQAIALNDYSSDIPLADFASFDVIMAIRRNGDYMSVRDKGPLFIVYPFDSAASLQSDKYYARSAWQLAQLVVS